MQYLLDAKLLALVAFLLVVILTNLVKGYRIHKPRNQPFSLSEFCVYSKNRTSEFFGVTKNVYIAFCILGGMFTIVSLNYFYDTAGKKGIEAVDSAKETVTEQAQEVKETVGEGFDELAEKQRILESKVDAISNHKDDIIQEIRKEKKRQTRQPATIGNEITTTEVEPLKLTPSAPLSSDDTIIIEKDDSLYSGERKSTALRPSTE